MGSELHAGSLATHWFLVLNFKRFPRYASMNLSWYFPGNSNGLGYSNLWEDQSPFWCAAAAALLPHVLGAAVPSWGRDASSASSWQQPTGPTPHPLPRLNSKAVGEVTNTRSEGQIQGKMPSRNVDGVCYLHSGGEEEGTTSHTLGCMPQQLCSLLTWAGLTHNLKNFTNHSQACTSTRTHR